MKKYALSAQPTNERLIANTEAFRALKSAQLASTSQTAQPAASRVAAAPGQAVESDDYWKSQYGMMEQPPTFGGDYPAGCRVIKIETPAFVRMQCTSGEAMQAYSVYCCKWGNVYEFGTMAKWAVMRDKKRRAVFVAPNPATVTDGETAWRAAHDAVSFRGDYKTAVRLNERGAQLGFFSSMVDLARLYSDHGKELGLAPRKASLMSQYWIDTARQFARKSGQPGYINYMRNNFPLPGELTDADKFNNALMGFLEADRAARRAYEECKREVARKYGQVPLKVYIEHC